MILIEHHVKKDEYMWKVGDEAKFAFMISKGSFKFANCSESELGEFVTGVFIGEIEAMINNTPLTTSIYACADGIIFKIEKDDLMAYLNRNPGLFVLFSQVKFFE